MRGHRWMHVAIGLLAVVGLSLLGLRASAQNPRRTAGAQDAAQDGAKETVDVRIQQIIGNGAQGLVLPPEYEVRNFTKTTARARNWGQIRVIYDTRSEWTDQLEFKYHILMLSSDPAATKTKYTLLEGAVTYMDVQRGNAHESTVYLHPNTLARFGEVVACAVEITVGGKTYEKDDVTAKAGVGGKKWWSAISSDASVTVKTGYVLERTETPFAFVNFDSYEQVLK